MVVEKRKIGQSDLERRPLQCFRCLALGHTKKKCLSIIDRNDWCFNCGGQDHKKNVCRNKPSCPVCESRGLRHDHKPGEKGCVQVAPRSLQKRSCRETLPAFRAVYIPENGAQNGEGTKSQPSGKIERAREQSQPVGSKVVKSPKARREETLRTKLTQAAKTSKAAKKYGAPSAIDEHKSPKETQKEEVTSAALASPARSRQLVTNSPRTESPERLGSLLLRGDQREEPGNSEQTSK